MDIIKSVGLTGVAVLVAFYLVRDVLGPLVKYVTRRAKGETEPHDKSHEPIAPRVAVLEVNLGSLETRVADFHQLLEQSGAAMDNKLDIVLEELKDMRGEFTRTLANLTERITRTETHVEHLLRNKARGEH